jgi:hypothetical protein
MDCWSGFPAANSTAGRCLFRGWKAAPTIKPTPKILKLTPMRPGLPLILALGQKAPASLGLTIKKKSGQYLAE